MEAQCGRGLNLPLERFEQRALSRCKGTLGSRKATGRTASTHPAPQQRLTPRAALTRIPPRAGTPLSPSRHTLSSQHVAHSHPIPQKRLTPRAALTRIPPHTGDPLSPSRHTLSSQQVAHSHPIPQKRLTPRAALKRVSPLVCYLPTTSPNDLEPQPDAQKSA